MVETNIDKVEINYKKALLLYKKNDFNSAEKLLLENIEISAEDCNTYDLLIKIYEMQNKYHALIKVLDRAIKYCKARRSDYRELRKVAILSELLKDVKNSR